MNAHRTQRRRSRVLLRVAAAALAGGVLPASCQTRLHDSVIEGTKNFVSTLLDPSRYIENLFALPPEE